MSVGFPAKTTFVDGNFLPASDLNDLGGTLNLKRYSGETLLTTTAVTNSASMSIASIASAYSHLRIVLSNLATVSTSVTLAIRLNNNSGSVYSVVFATSNSASVQNAIAANTAVLTSIATSTANTNNISGELHIPRYTDTANYKTVDYSLAFLLGGSGAAEIVKGSVMTTDTTAITSIQFIPSSGNFTAQGNIYVYGIA